MSQEMNKKAVADLFCIEDARAVCEAIGGLGLNPEEGNDEPLEYTPENILDVKINENPDGMPAFPQVGEEEMDNETKAFVADELAKQLQADGRESLSAEDLIPFVVKIKGENHISQDLTSFIDQLTSGADARLATQNTSEAQPNGVATDLTNGGEGAQEPAVPEAPVPGADTLPPEAPGGLAEPAEAPALDTNTDDSFSLDVPAAEPAPEGDFNLDVPEPAAEVAPEGDDSFNLDIGEEPAAEPAADEGTDTIGELDFGDDDKPAEEPAADDNGSSDEDDLFSALDGMSDEALDDGKDDDGEENTEEKSDDEKPAETEGVEDEQQMVAEEPAEPAAAEEPVVECGDAAQAEPAAAEEPVVECGEACAEPATEPAAEPVVECGDAVDAKLESIRDDYVERIARDRVKAVVESYERKRAIAEKQALCESIIAGYKARKESEDRKNLVESTMGEKISELGDKMAAMLEGTESKDSLDAKFESILDKFGKDKAAMKATEKLDAKLESILSKAVADKEADRKLAAIVESVKNPAPAAKKEGLDARLESIIADAKKKIAAAK